MQQQGQRSFYLPVDEVRSLYVEEHGNPEGIPVVVLHGGPGAGMSLKQLETFDPSAFRIVIFDQRGAGRSTPHADLDRNTTTALVADMELLRDHLGIDKWLVSGGSWGSCLALAYGEAHPDRCLGFRLHGIFLAGKEDIDWWFNGVRAIFPDQWEEFAAFIPEAERGDLLSAYYRRLTSGNAHEEVAAALSLRSFSAKTQTFLPDPGHVAALMEPMAALAVARLFTHYCMHGAFLAPGQLLRDIGRIRHLPCEIAQGRYDTVTPMASAWRLYRAWPEAGFSIVTEANHQSTKGPLFEELKNASERLRGKLVAVNALESRRV
ncbi:prolyl aminopeptidase [Neorhizobium galegae]|uniref:Proline iminopeptidase n=1 Tax=Neorhizobium galegae bv. orientalis str. HAMBI 540 TaxID=1028800 RepID=A0A068T1H2_NEOGA|nr:prolyl aminopeptidase [Neorhizobium galegae]MCQ1854545.1 prolyl aminopeptidase [Neorhizobium galegae]CDN51899.1 Prolyl aminopeptidase [Neorhizobium galegae bv. orientalis str. HAMBI 540]